MGLAAGWVTAFAEALAEAVSEVGLHRGKAEPARYKIITRIIEEDRLRDLSTTGGLSLRCVTPVALHNGNRVFFDRDAFADSLARRVWGLGAWHGLDLVLEENALPEARRRFSESVFEDLHWVKPWHVGRSKGPGAMRTGIMMRLLVPRPSAALSVLLGVGELMGAGGKTTEGLGRIEIGG